MEQPHNYFLVLFEKDQEGTPKPKGQKSISKEQYDQLCNDMFKEFATGETTWKIMERRCFEIAEQRQQFELINAIPVNCFIVIDAVKK